MDTLANNVFDCALVFEGGGYRGSFSAGISNALLQNGIHFDYVCGLSAGASNTINYLSRDQRRVRAAFVPEGKARAAVGLPSLVRGKGYFDADFLYEGAVADGTLPFDWETFSANPARARIQAFDPQRGRTVRFGREDMTDVERLVDLVRASSTLPGVMKPLPVDGRVLLDGGLGEGAGIPLLMAEEDGLGRFVFVATRERGYRKQPPTERDLKLYGRLGSEYPHLVEALATRSERYNAELERVEALAAEGRCLIIYPNHMSVESGTVSARKLASSYEAGHAQGMREMPRIREFLFGAPNAGPEPVGADAGAYVTIG